MKRKASAVGALEIALTIRFVGRVSQISHLAHLVAVRQCVSQYSKQQELDSEKARPTDGRVRSVRVRSQEDI